MGSSNVYTSTAGIKFSDGTSQLTAGVPASSEGNTITLDSTGITMQDPFGNMLQLSQDYAFLTLNNSGGGLSVFFDGTNYGAGVSDGNGNALLLGDGFGNFNLSNAPGHAGIISTAADNCYVYGNPLYVGVAGGSVGLNISSTGTSVVGPAFTIPSNVPATSSSAGEAGMIAWDSSRLYLCVAHNTWLRSAVMATW